jgi:hypothetical protein
MFCVLCVPNFKNEKLKTSVFYMRKYGQAAYFSNTV